MSGPKIDMEALDRACRYQNWAKEHWQPCEFPRIGSKEQLSIDEVTALDWTHVIPDEHGFMFKYPFNESSFHGHTANISGEKDNFMTPYHENLEEALRVYLPNGHVAEAAAQLRQEGRQVYVGPGIVLVKNGYGVWCNQAQKKQMKRFEARCQITPTVDLAPYLRQLMAWHPDVREFLERLKTFGGKQVAEDSLLPERAELIKWERDASPGGLCAVSTFYVWSGKKDDLGLHNESPVTLLYRTEGLVTQIALPSDRDTNNHYSNLVLATVRQKLPE